jgi:hypothetical protein
MSATFVLSTSEDPGSYGPSKPTVISDDSPAAIERGVAEKQLGGPIDSLSA